MTRWFRGGFPRTKCTSMPMAWTWIAFPRVRKKRGPATGRDSCSSRGFRRAKEFTTCSTRGHCRARQNQEGSSCLPEELPKTFDSGEGPSRQEFQFWDAFLIPNFRRSTEKRTCSSSLLCLRGTAELY